MLNPPEQFPRADLATKLANATVQVVLGFKKSPGDWSFERLPLHGNLQEEFRKHAEAVAVDLRDNHAGRPYDPEWDLKSDEFFYVSNDPPVGGNFFEAIQNFVALDEYKPAARAKKPNV